MSGDGSANILTGAAGGDTLSGGGENVYSLKHDDTRPKGKPYDLPDERLAA